MEKREFEEEEIDAAWANLEERIAPLRPLLDAMTLGISARRAAEFLSLRDSADLRRWLISRRLPQWVILRDWYIVVRLLAHCANTETLSRMATNRIESSSVYYTFVQRVTGAGWKELLKRGLPAAKRRALAIFEAQSD
jgi:hypothetical protein